MIHALWASLTLVFEAIFIFLIFTLVFAITGFQLFKGVLNSRCILPFIGIENSPTDGENLCGNIDCSFGSICVSTTLINNKITNFDNILTAFLQVIRIITFDNWTKLMNDIQKVWTNFSFAYFILVGTIGNFFLIQFIFAVVKIKFGDAIYNLKTGKKFLEPFTFSNRLYDFKGLKNLKNLDLSRKHRMPKSKFFLPNFLKILNGRNYRKVINFVKTRIFTAKNSKIQINKKNKNKAIEFIRRTLNSLKFQKLSIIMKDISRTISNLVSINYNENVGMDIPLKKRPISLKIRNELNFEANCLDDVLPTRLEKYYEDLYSKLMKDRKTLKFKVDYNFLSVKKEILEECESFFKNKATFKPSKKLKFNYCISGFDKKHKIVERIKEIPAHSLLSSSFLSIKKLNNEESEMKSLKKKKKTIKFFDLTVNKENIVHSLGENLNSNKDEKNNMEDNSIIYVNKRVKYFLII